MIQVQALTKSYGVRPVLRGLNLDIAEGECLMLIGPNGAGKTTFLRILAGLTRPGAGRVSIAGLDMAQHAAQIRRQIGFLSHQPLLYEDLTAEENLTFYGRMYEVGNLASRMQALLEQVDLWDRRADLVRTFSRGMRQRLSIARAMLHSPTLLLLDEPYTGLDPQAAEMLNRLFLQSGVRAYTIVLTTHNPEQSLGLTDRVAILVRGRVTAELSGSALTAERIRDEYRLRTLPGGG